MRSDTSEKTGLRSDIFAVRSDVSLHPNPQAGHIPSIPSDICSTGFTALDTLLPDAGWPPAGLTELHTEREGIGELRLLMPFLSQLSAQQPATWIAWIAPPYIPYAPALTSVGVDLGRQLLIQSVNRKDMLWTLEQTLASGACGAVLAWPDQLAYPQLRRLQLAARSGHCPGFLFYTDTPAKPPSPATLRLRLSRHQHQLSIDILKCRGGRFPHRLDISIEPLNKQHVMA